MQIYVFKLLSGEDVIGELIEETNGIVTIKNPMVIMMQPPNQMGMADMLIYSPQTDKKGRFSRSTIVVQYIPHDGIIQGYQKMTGRLIVPPKPTLVGLDS